MRFTLCLVILRYPWEQDYNLQVMGGYESNECWWYLCPPGGSLAHNCYLRPVGWLPGAAVDCKPILDSGVSTLISPPHILSPPAASGQSDDDTFTARSVLEMMMLFIHKLQWLYLHNLLWQYKTTRGSKLKSDLKYTSDFFCFEAFCSYLMSLRKWHCVKHTEDLHT